MTITATQLKRQFNRVVADDLWPLLVEAARDYFPGGEFDAADLFAVGSRETNWNKRYQRETGDHGNGFGYMQIDKRAFPKWVALGKWREPREAIRKGAEVLRAKYEQARANQGRKIVVPGGYSIVGKRLGPVALKRVAIAAYNSGIWAHYHASKGRSADHGTTGKDYSADVLARATKARAFKS